MKNAGYWPKISETLMKGMISVSPDSSHTEKTAKFLSLGYLVLFNSQNILMFRLPALCCKLLYNLTPPPSSLERFSQGHLRCYLLGLSPKNSHQIKLYSQPLGCDHLSRQQLKLRLYTNHISIKLE